MEKIKVMVADDSGLARLTLRRVLEGAGYQVVEARDGGEAVERYPREKPEVVFLDLVMPGMYGLEVLARLIEIDPGVRVVIATSDIQDTTHLMAQEGGAYGYINKPFTAEKVLAVIEALLGGAAGKEELP